MSNETDIIRNNLLDAINELTGLLEVCTDADQQFALRIKIRDLSRQLDQVTVAALDGGSPAFIAAIASIQTLTEQAKTAKEDLQRVAETINKAAQVLASIETLVKNAVGLMM